MVEQLHRIGFQTALAELKDQLIPLFDPEMVRPLEDELAPTVCRSIWATASAGF